MNERLEGASKGRFHVEIRGRSSKEAHKKQESASGSVG